MTRCPMDDRRLVTDKLLLGAAEVEDLADEPDPPQAGQALPNRINVDPEAVEKGLARLVLTIIELLRQLMERQAVRRVEGGSLTDEEIERLGLAFMKLKERMQELKEVFGLRDEDLNLDLGPLGDLL